MYFQVEWKTLWILIRWFYQKPADLDLHSVFKEKQNWVQQTMSSEVYLFNMPVFINKNTCLFVFGHKLDSAAVISCLVVSSKKCKQFSIDLGGLGVTALFINPHAQTLKPIPFVSNYVGSPYY